MLMLVRREWQGRRTADLVVGSWRVIVEVADGNCG